MAQTRAINVIEANNNIHINILNLTKKTIREAAKRIRGKSNMGL